MNATAIRTREVETAATMLLITLWPLVLVYLAFRHLTAESNARIAAEAARDRAANRARTRGALAFAREQAALDQTALYTLAVPAVGTYPEAVPVACYSPVQTTAAEQEVVSVAYAMPEAVDLDALVSTLAEQAGQEEVTAREEAPAAPTAPTATKATRKPRTPSPKAAPKASKKAARLALDNDPDALDLSSSVNGLMARAWFVPEGDGPVAVTAGEAAPCPMP